MQEGDNLLALQGLNDAADSPDFLVRAELIEFGLNGSAVGYYYPPTPGAPNGTSVPMVAAPVEFSKAGGLFTNDLVVTLATTTPGGVIHYTLNGDTPTQDSPVYSGPIAVTNSALVTAVAIGPGTLASPPASESYTLLEPSALEFTSNLPLVILDSFGRYVPADAIPKVPVSVTFIDTAQPSGRASLFGKIDFHGRAGLEQHGQSSLGFPKKSLNLEIEDDYGNDKNASLLGFPSESDFVLYAPYSDKTFMNNFLAYTLHEKMGHYAVRRKYVEVFVNGTRLENSGTPDPSGKVGTNDYAGIYVLLEKIKIGPDRVDLARLQPEDDTEPKISGGYIWKKDKDSPGDINFSTVGGNGFPAEALKYHDPDVSLTIPQRQWLVNYLDAFERTLYGANWRDPVNGYAQYIDVDSFVDYHWLVEFPKQIDGYRLSNYMSKDREGKIKMEPVWDWNLSFGNANYLRGGMTNGWYWNLGPDNPQNEGIGPAEHIWLRRLIYGQPNIDAASVNDGPGDPDFKQKIIDRWGELRTGLFQPSNLLARVDEITNYLNEAQARDFARWPRLGTYVWPNPNGAASGWSVDYQNPTTYAGIIGELKKFITGRYAWIDSQFLHAPDFSRNGGRTDVPLSMSALAGTIYYTTDGSDPRLPGGELSPHAIAYAGSFVPAPDARIVARAWQTSDWSPPTKAKFGDYAPLLALTELMYHPAGSSDTNYTEEDYEFLEFMNPGTDPIDLTGMRLADGVYFNFPAGPPVEIGELTTNNFDEAGTAFALSTLGEGPGAMVTNGGPAGDFLRLVQQDTGTNRDRIAFDQTATGAFDVVTADFDFRVNNASAPPTVGAPLDLDFDQPGSTYVLTNYSGEVPAAVLPADSGSDGSFLRLTTATNDESAGLFFDRANPGPASYIRINFDFRIDGAADGMGLALLSTSTYGITGAAATGFGEEVALPGSLGIGFDIYNNGSPMDPNANHISLHRNGAKVADATPTFSLASGQFHRAEIVFNFSGGNLYVTVKITPDVHSGNTTAETLFDEYQLSGLGMFENRLAFGARTGGSSAVQDLDNIHVEYLNDLVPAGGLSMLLLPVNQFGASGAGSTLSDFVGQPRLSHVFALNLEVHSADFINDVGVFWDQTLIGNAFIPPAVLDLDNGVFHHVHLQLTHVSEGSMASVVVTPDIFGTPGTPLNVVSNLFIPGLAPADARVEFAGHSGGLNLDIDVENVLAQFETYGPNWLDPGERIMVVKNQDAFESRYGTEFRIAGEYTGSLANSGEHLLLTSSWGAPILDFTYRDGWYPLTDGEGFSLVFNDPTAMSAAWNDSANWSMSSAQGGSPGQAETTPPVFVPVVINEALPVTIPATSDEVELHNPSSQDANIGGWYLSDNFNTPKKYRFPMNTTIAAGGFLVLDESDFNAIPGSPTSFALRAEGEEIYLFSADAAGELTGYYHGFAFGPAEDNVTFGRYVISTGEEHFVAQASATLGQTNSGPKVGPVVINEIMYHPPDYPGGIDNQDFEFVELKNITDQPAALYDPAYPANAWRLRDAVDFDFAPATEIPAQGYLLVVSFDPAVDADLLAAFRAQYNLPMAAPIVGPYRGKLANDKDNVELKKPGRPDLDTLVPEYILVDKVDYLDQAPWPLAADGIGRSLQRLDATQYGNDPINWTDGAPTPAEANTSGAAPVIVTQPADQTIVAGLPATFTVAATGDEPLTYQWRFNGSNLPGETNAMLLLPAVQSVRDGAYQVVVLSPAGSVDSDAAMLTVQQTVNLLSNPAGQSVILNITPTSITPDVNVTFNVSALGNGPISFQWLKDGADIPDATTDSLTVAHVRPADDGTYSVRITDDIGAVVSAPAALDVLVRPYLTLRPVNQTVVAGDSVSFTVGVSNVATLPISYRWRRNGSDYTNMLLYAHESTLLIPNVVSNLHAGRWDIVIVNDAGTVVGFPPAANLTVLQPPYFIQQPAAQVVNPGGAATFTPVAVGTAPLSYQWFFNEINPLTGETSPNLSIGGVSEVNEGAYTLVVTNLYGAVTSDVATLMLRQMPSVITQPTNVEVTVCEPAAEFTVAVAGGGPYSYQWFFNETNVLAEATNATLVLTPAQPEQAGSYHAVITNGMGSITSLLATLSFVWGDCDGDGLPDQWELANGLDPTDPADSSLDADMDGLSNEQEFLANTDPQDALSVLKVRLADGGNGEAILEFTSMPEVGYTIQYVNQLGDAVWVNWTNLPPTAGTNIIQVSDPSAGMNGGRYYRIITPMVPE